MVSYCAPTWAASAAWEVVLQNSESKKFFPVADSSWIHIQVMVALLSLEESV